MNPFDTQAIPFMGTLVVEGQAKLAAAVGERRTRVEGLKFFVEVLADDDLGELGRVP